MTTNENNKQLEPQAQAAQAYLSDSIPVTMHNKFPLSVTGLCKSYGSHQVLDNVRLELAPGTITGLLGRNGAGKTTLIRTAVGLLRPDQGQAKLFGHPAFDSPDLVRQRIGYVQQKSAAVPWMSARKAISLVGSFYPNWNEALIDSYAKQWKIPMHQTLRNMSEGQRQKTSILMALGHLPALLILDEPVASLDPAARHEFLRAILQLNQERGMTILFSSHITTDIERIAADVAILNGGQIAYHGGLDDLKDSIQCIYLRSDCPLDVSRIDGFISSRRDGNRIQVWVRHWNEEKEQQLERLTGGKIFTDSVGLDELFMGVTS